MNLSIATMNLWGLPWPFSIHKAQRIHDCGAIIRQKNLDIIALQEIWVGSDVKKIQSAFPEYHVFAKSNTAYNPSGLVLLSKFPLTFCSVTPFDMPLIHKEIPSRKGVLKAHIDLHGKTITIINTHLYFGAKREMVELQISQLRQLRNLLSEEPTLLMGDFNVTPGQLILPGHFKNLTDPKMLTIDRDTLYSQKRFNKLNGSSRTPDMIWANFPVTVRQTYAISEPLISDHFPLVAHITI